MKIGKYFLINWDTLLSIIVAWAVAVFMHNLIYSIWKIEEPFFFVVGVFIIPLYLIVSLFYSIYHYRNKKINTK